jgi:outer membrane protein assembly factor BamB
LYTNRAIVYPEQPGLRFLDPRSFSETGFLPLPELLMTTPAILGNVIYVVDFIGTLHAVSLSDYSILWSSKTPLEQPAGLSLTIHEGEGSEKKGFIGDTKGNIIAVNLEDGKVIWSAKMPKRVTSNIVVDNDLAYVWSDGVIYSLSIVDGSESGSQFSGAATPPLVTDGRIYYGSNKNKLLVYDTGNSKLLYEYELNTSITTSPRKIGSFIVVGLESGEIAIINEEAFDF